MRSLRQRCDFLASSPVDRAWVVFIATRSALINFALAVIVMLAAGHLTGLVVHFLVGLAPPWTWGVPIGMTVFPIAGSILAVTRGHREGAVRRIINARTTHRLALASSCAGGTAVMALLGAQGLRLVHGQQGKVQTVLKVFPSVGTRTASLMVVSLLAAIVCFLGLSVALPRPWRRQLRGALGYFGAALILGGPFVWALDGARVAAWDVSARAVTIEVGVLIALALLFDANSYSLFPIYRSRLRSAFFRARPRTADERADQHGAGTDEMYSRLTYSALDKALNSVLLRSDGVCDLELISCAAVNLNDRSSADGRPFEPFIFGRRCGSASTRFLDASDYERVALPDGTPIDLATIMAISGAAVSPTMGRYTKRSTALLLALLNLRMGVWLNNPKYVNQNATTGEAGRQRRWLGHPSALDVFAEGLASIGGAGQRVFVTDGGHYDNLGLVTLLDRGCDIAIALDSSLESRGSLTSFHHSLGLLRSRGWEVSLDDEAEFTTDGRMASPVVLGWVSRQSRRTRLVYLRCELYEGMSPDLKEYHRQCPSFPRHPTLYQFFTADLIDAYYLLGRDVARLANTGALLQSGRRGHFDGSILRDIPLE